MKRIEGLRDALGEALGIDDDAHAPSTEIEALRHGLLATLPVVEAAVALANNEFLDSSGVVDLKERVRAAVREFGLGDAACASGRVASLRDLAGGGGDYEDGLPDDS